jgi:hypothetical protein
MKKIVLVAGDLAPSLAFEQLRIKLEQLGWATDNFLGHGMDMSSRYIPSAIINSDAVIIGMSSTSNRVKEEILAAEEAIKRGIPIGFYADTYGVHRRPWFEDIRDKAAWLFVINREEAANAKPLFPHAQIIATGNPLWENFFFPRLTRKESRKKLGIADNQTLILCPGIKLLMVNAALFINTIEAAHQLMLMKKKPVIVISIHPGDPNPPEIYNDLSKYSQVPVKIITRDFLPTSDIIPGADILVDFCSTTAIEAIHQRIPVINFFTEIQLGRLKKIIGSREWALDKLGVAKAIYSNPLELAWTINRLLTSEGFAPMCLRQKIVFPAPPAKGTAINKMAEAISAI